MVAKSPISPISPIKGSTSDAINENEKANGGPSLLVAPPLPKGKYSPSAALDDLPRAHYAINAFMASQMVESEEYCKNADPKSERLFMTTGYGVIQAVKAMMSYEDADILAALELSKKGLTVAQAHRKRAPAFTARLAGFVTGGATSGVPWIKSMTAVERHAELVYAETLFEKAILGILYSGDWLAFIKEALNLRATMNIYHTLGKFVTEADAAHAKGHDPSLDAHFRSGVCLGVGTSHLMMSLMPSRLQTLVELLGYHGDRDYALELLCKPGGWTKDSDEPGTNAEQEGMRRSVCDIILLVFHLVLSSFTYKGVDVGMADKIVKWNLKRSPSGIIWRFGEGRVALKRSQPTKALTAYTHAMDVQEQFRSLKFISYWEMAVAHLALYDITSSTKCWRQLVADATWSKAVYTYGLAVCLLASASSSDTPPVTARSQHAEAYQLMASVPGLRQRIAGKSIPLEKFVARRARRFAASPATTKRLCLPSLELAYVFGALQCAPRSVICGKMLPLARAEVARLQHFEGRTAEYAKDGVDVKGKGKGKEDNGEVPTPTTPVKDKDVPILVDGGYWDDRCLARFLQGICARTVAYPDKDAESETSLGSEYEEMTAAAMAAEAKAAFEDVLKWGSKIELDHHLVYHAHFELGRLLACEGDVTSARKHLEYVSTGKSPDLPGSKRVGKYSMENALVMRTQAALDEL